MNYLMTNKNIPLFILIIGVLLFISQFISFSLPKKKTVIRRTSTYKKQKTNIVTRAFIKLVNMNETLTSRKDKLAYELGYFTNNSDIKNSNLAEIYYANYIQFILIELVGILVVSKMGLALNCILFIALVFMQGVLWNFLVSGKKLKLKNQFPLMIGPFTTRYAETLNITEAFQRSRDDMPKIYKNHILRLINELNRNKGIDDALSLFDKRIDYSLCSCFVSILKGSTATHTDIVKSLITLETMIARDRASDKKAKESLKERKNNVYLLAALIGIEILLVGNYAKSYTGNYFFTTVDGQMLLLGSVASIVIAIIIIVLTERT